MTRDEGTRLIIDPRGRGRRQIGEYELLVAPSGAEPRRVTVGETCFRVGSQRGNDLVIVDDSVSRYHLEIVAGPAGYLARDLDTTNGTWLEGLRIKEAYLPQRARLRLGRVPVEFTLSGAVRELPSFDGEQLAGIVGSSPVMRELLHQLQRVAATTATVLVEGESGTGKELVARAVHRASARSGGPFVAFDCAAMPASLAESFLFGHERGAFTGADRPRAGCFEEADGGTLFLDELGELPADLQPKLLRVLETREVRRIGGAAPRSVDVRLVAATNRELAREVNRGAFRADLYYRLAVVVLRLPPLRERPEDVRPLVRHFIEELLRDDPQRAQQTLAGISSENWQRLEQLPWPGNVRELRNFIERTLALSEGPRTENIPAPRELGGAAAAFDLDRDFISAKADAVAAFERAYLLGQLARHGDNISAAARASGMDRMNFKRVLRKYR